MSTTLREGQPAPWPMPPGDSAGWHWPFTVVVGADNAAPDLARQWRSARWRFGLLVHDSMPVLVLETPIGVYEMPRLWLHDEDLPVEDGHTQDHLLWAMVLVQQDTVTRLSAVTTSPEFSRAVITAVNGLRRIGPLSMSESTHRITSYYADVPNATDLFAGCVATSWAGS